MVRAASQNPWTQQEAAACLDGLCGAPRPGIGTWGCSAGTALGIIIPIAQMRKQTQRGCSSPILDGRLESRAPSLFLPGHLSRSLGK